MWRSTTGRAHHARTRSAAHRLWLADRDSAGVTSRPPCDSAVAPRQGSFVDSLYQRHPALVSKLRIITRRNTPPEWHSSHLPDWNGPGGRRRRDFLVLDELVRLKLGQALNRHRHSPRQESGAAVSLLVSTVARLVILDCGQTPMPSGSPRPIRA